MKYLAAWPIVLVWAGCLGGGVAILAMSGYDKAKAYLAGESGQVAPFRDCEWVEDSATSDDGWECRGVFTGGGLRVNDVRIRPRLAERPAGQIPATVSGPDATVAWTVTDGVQMLGPAVAAGFIVSLAPILTAGIFREELAAALSRRRKR